MKKGLLCIFLFASFFVFTSNINALKIGKITSPTKVEVKNGPNETYQTYKKLSYNDAILIINTVPEVNTKNCSFGWYQINIDGYSKYICGDKITKSQTMVHSKKNSIKIYNDKNLSSVYKTENKNKSFYVIDSKIYKTKSCKNGIYKVNYDGYAKYICGKDIKTKITSTNVIVTTNKARLYTVAKRPKAVKTVKYNQVLTLYDTKKYQKKKFYKVYYNGHVRYIRVADVLKTKRHYIVTSRSGVALKQKPNKNKIITRVKYGDYVSLVNLKKYRGKGCSAGYYKTQINKKIGYICSSFLSNAGIITNANEKAGIYHKTNTVGTRLATINKNEKIILKKDKKYKGKNCNDGYYKAVVNGKEGYICSTYTTQELRNAKKIPIFTFHRIVTDETKNLLLPHDQWTESYSMFQKQIEYLYNNEYKTINLDEFYCWYKGECNFPKKTVVLVFDDGNLDDYYLVMPTLKKYGFKGTTFLVGSRVKEKQEAPYEDTIRRYISQDIIDKTKEEYPDFDLQSHSYNFHYVDKNNLPHVKNMTKEEIMQDFEYNKKFGFKYIAYPYGIYTKDLQEASKESGYRLGFWFGHQDYATRKSNPYLVPRIKINGYSNIDTLKNYLLY